MYSWMNIIAFCSNKISIKCVCVLELNWHWVMLSQVMACCLERWSLHWNRLQISNSSLPLAILNLLRSNPHLHLKLLFLQPFAFLLIPLHSLLHPLPLLLCMPCCLLITDTLLLCLPLGTFTFLLLPLTYSFQLTLVSQLFLKEFGFLQSKMQFNLKCLSKGVTTVQWVSARKT